MRRAAGALLCCLATGAAAQERVAARALRDMVQVQRADGERQVLWLISSPRTQLTAGDTLHVGSSGATELLLSAGGRVVLHSTGRLLVEQLGAAGDVLRVPQLVRLDVRAGTRPLTVHLPGGLRCVELENASLSVRVDDAGMWLRHQGGAGIQLERGPSGDGGGRGFELQRGRGLRLPLYLVEEAAPGNLRQRWAGRAVLHGPELAVTLRGAMLGLRHKGGDEPAAVRLGGVRGRVPPGSRWLVVDARLAAPPAGGGSP